MSKPKAHSFDPFMIPSGDSRILCEEHKEHVCHAPDIFRLFFFLVFPLLQDIKTFSSDYDHQNIRTPLFIADLE